MGMRWHSPPMNWSRKFPSFGHNYEGEIFSIIILTHLFSFWLLQSSIALPFPLLPYPTLPSSPLLSSPLSSPPPLPIIHMLSLPSRSSSWPHTILLFLSSFVSPSLFLLLCWLTSCPLLSLPIHFSLFLSPLFHSFLFTFPSPSVSLSSFSPFSAFPLTSSSSLLLRSYLHSSSSPLSPFPSLPINLFPFPFSPLLSPFFASSYLLTPLFLPHFSCSRSPCLSVHVLVSSFPQSHDTELVNTCGTKKRYNH
mgnify:CR=1 FL=1